MAASSNSSRVIVAVLNLSWTCIKKDLRSHFSKYGRVASVQIPMDLKTGFNKRVGFVELFGPVGFEEKVYEDFHTIDNTEVLVRPSHHQENRDKSRKRVSASHTKEDE